MTYGIVYGIWNVDTGKWYVGSTRHPRDRYTTHLRMLNKDIHHSIRLQSSWNKHGPNAFKFVELDYADDEGELCFLEDFYTDYYDAFENGYVCAKGRDVRIMSPEAKELIRQNTILRNTGIRFTDERKRRISESHMGKTLTDKHKLNISLGSKGHVKTVQDREHKSLSRRRNWISDKVLSPDGVIHTVTNARLFASQYPELKHQSLTALLRGKYTHTKQWTLYNESQT